MLKNTLCIGAAIAALSAPAAFATEVDGAFGGGVSSTSITGGFASSGGVAAFGSNGLSSVENAQYATNSSGAQVNVGQTEFTATTFSEGTQGSQTIVNNTGFGTAGFGSGSAISFGGADAGGGFTGFTGW